MDEMVYLRQMFLNYSIHERIEILHEIAQVDENPEQWQRFIPHEMKNFDSFFEKYSPSEIMRICALSGKNIVPYQKQAVEGCYFTFNAKLQKIMLVWDIEAALREVFDKLLRNVGVNQIKRVLLTHQDGFGGCTYTLSKKELQGLYSAIERNDLGEDTVVEIHLLEIKNKAHEGKCSTLCEIFEKSEQNGKRLIYESPRVGK